MRRVATNTGSGGDADFLRRSYDLSAFPPNTWVATVVYVNGRSANLPERDLANLRVKGDPLEMKEPPF